MFVALLLGGAHVAFNYIADGSFTYDAVLRAALFLIVAYIVGAIAEKKDLLLDALRHSEERLTQMHDSLESRVSERTDEITRMNASLRNEIQEREHAEKALRDSEEKFRVLAEASPAAILLYRQGGLIYANRATEAITGYTHDELLSMEPWQFVHPDSRELVLHRALARLRGEDVPTRYEVRLITKGGEEKWFDVSALLIIYGGIPTGLISGIDITKRKNAQKALMKSQAILARAQSIAHVGNWAWDLKAGEMLWSDEIYRIFGYEPKEARLKYAWIRDHIHQDDVETVVRTTFGTIQEDTLFNIDFRIICADGSVKYVNCVADKLRRNKTGTPTWLYGIVQDITARKQVEAALQESKAQAELYLDLMGHDINNLNQIGMGFLELALDTPGLDDRAKQMIAKPLEALESSTRLIANVRKLQRAKDGGFALHSIDVGEVIGRLIPQYSKVAGRNITINFTPAGAYPVLANELLTDVFSNILGNAIKHSAGPLAINIGLKSTVIDDKQYCVVDIEDDGPGIPNDVKAILFAGHGRDHLKKSGRGIGLYLVRTLVEDFHGHVRVEDRVAGDYRKGSRFVVALPALEN